MTKPLILQITAGSTKKMWLLESVSDSTDYKVDVVRSTLKDSLDWDTDMNLDSEEEDMDHQSQHLSVDSEAKINSEKNNNGDTLEEKENPDHLKVPFLN